MAFSLCVRFIIYLLLSSFTIPQPDTVVVAVAASSSSAVEDGDGDGGLYPKILRDEAVSRLYELGKVSDAEAYLERTLMSPASTRATQLIRTWMEDAGLTTWIDQMGNLHGRLDAFNSTSKLLLIGSHLVIAFSDEEGVRFQSTFLGSAALAGKLPASALHISDKSGATVQEALKSNSLEATEENLHQLKYDPGSVWGYTEVHIEQGPVLEQAGIPLGVVKGIAGQSRLKVTVRGSQGHAGTVPMSMRKDPMAAAAELIVLVENICKHPEDFLSFDEHCKDSSAQSLSGFLVCTVGEISPWPSASNVIPGQVVFTVDIRAMDDMGREAVIYEFVNRMYQICDRRSVSCNVERKHDAGSVMCDPELSTQLKSAASSALRKMADEFDGDVPVLMSGAGHDAMAISHLTKVGMIFVRCRGGINHSPKEYVLADDVWAAGLTVLAFLQFHM